MPKNKTHSGMKKRVRRTGSGKLMRERTNNRHLLEHKSSSRKRRNGIDVNVDRTNKREVRRLLGI
ncbi:50S ribosomal protein L35 [Neoactinobaculum massilliense]|uniref:50S ribosomal protein L35 n=1 Tax=Neoactinobaculum massilliense TaxID=2364794 RepID=UPI000F54A574|nr:50S ribosomal protein L35 [Neoactinobaculum massilliense]